MRNLWLFLLVIAPLTSTASSTPQRVGGSVSAPVLVYSISPEYTEEARIEKRSGNVLVNLWVDTNGNPSHVHTLRGVGLGLDEKAVEAVKQYKFKPALKKGEPVLVEINVEVNFTNRLILIPVASHSSVFR
jgi:periplasmic protein TonB